MRAPSSHASLAAKIIGRLVYFLRPDVEIRPLPTGVHVDWNVPIVLRDGTLLRANVFRPAQTEVGSHVPVIMSAHPYNKDAIPAKSKSGRGINIQYRMLPQPSTVRFSAWTGWEAPDPAIWVPRGYAIVNVDLRGGGKAGGSDDLFSDQEAQDYYEAIEWASAQPWSSGRVGLLGVSYLALSQYRVAALRPPHLAAICPWEGFSDLYRDSARPGGVLENGFTWLWWTVTRHSARVRGNLWHELVSRPTRDAWYQARTPDLERIEVPVLVCGSFSDQNLHTRGSFEVFCRAGSTHKWLYTHREGKWACFYGQEASATQAAFFDWALKGKANGWEQTPPVRLAIHEEGPHPIEVRYEREWPPAGLEWTKLRLDLSSRTLSEPDTPAASSVALDTRGDGLTLDWTVRQDLDVIGPMALRLYVEAVGCDDIHLFVGVRKFHRSIESTFEGSYGFNGDMVTHGWQRAAFRQLDERLSKPWQPVHTFQGEEWLRPGEIVPVDVELRPQATRFRIGDSLRLEIRGTWFYPRNPFTGQFPAGFRQSPRGRFVIHGGGEHDAYLYLGVTHATTRELGTGVRAGKRRRCSFHR